MKYIMSILAFQLRCDLFIVLKFYVFEVLWFLSLRRMRIGRRCQSFFRYLDY